MAATPQSAATGPKTSEGKARSSKNALKHGLTATGYLTRTKAESEEFERFYQELETQLDPFGALEVCATEMIANAAWRLRKIMRLMQDLSAKYNADPLAVPEAHAALKQLTRYRAAEEMNFYRGLKELEQLQQGRAIRDVQTVFEEEYFLPLHIDAATFAKATAGYDDRRRMIGLLFRAGSSHKPVVDDLGYTTWVEKTEEERQAEIDEQEAEYAATPKLDYTPFLKAFLSPDSPKRTG